MISRARRALAADSSNCPSARCASANPARARHNHGQAAQVLSLFDDRLAHCRSSSLIPEGKRGIGLEEHCRRPPVWVVPDGDLLQEGLRGLQGLGGPSQSEQHPRFSVDHLVRVIGATPSHLEAAARFLDMRLRLACPAKGRLIQRERGEGAWHLEGSNFAGPRPLDRLMDRLPGAVVVLHLLGGPC